MAYFHCLIGGGSSGGGYELTVTCDADFAGTTITATDGVTTLTQTCPSASPYEVVFEIPNGGDWTISGVVGGHTISTGVSIPTSSSLIATIQQTVTIHSAKEDTISYVDIDGATQTITFASGQTSKQIEITIKPSGSSITFTSSVAKDPNNLSNDYSKTVTITDNTTDVYVMPDGALYWYGCEVVQFVANGYRPSYYGGGTINTPTVTRNTNDIRFAVYGQGGAQYNNIDLSVVNTIRCYGQLNYTAQYMGARLCVATVATVNQDHYTEDGYDDFTATLHELSIDVSGTNENRAICLAFSGNNASDPLVIMKYLFLE